MNDSEKNNSFKMTFTEKTISSSGLGESSSFSPFTKNEPRSEEVAFKKRKFPTKSNARRPLNEEDFAS